MFDIATNSKGIRQAKTDDILDDNAIWSSMHFHLWLIISWKSSYIPIKCLYVESMTSTEVDKVRKKKTHFSPKRILSTTVLLWCGASVQLLQRQDCNQVYIQRFVLATQQVDSHLPRRRRVSVWSESESLTMCEGCDDVTVRDNAEPLPLSLFST